MNYAVIESGGKQYLVRSGDVLEVDLLDRSNNESITFDKVLLHVEDKAVLVGKPYISDVAVDGTVIKEVKGDKIRVVRFRAKSRYRKTNGFRPIFTQVKIGEIKKTETKKETRKVVENTA